MTYTPPPIELGINSYGRERYLFTEPVFTYDHWVPSLVAINDAETIGDQRNAFTLGILGESAGSHGLRPTRINRATATTNYINARFRIESGAASLASVRAYGIRMGYQSPDTLTRNPAFAVCDDSAGHHNVFHSPDDKLTEVEKNLSHLVLRELAVSLNYLYPGFDLFDKLAEKNIQLREEV